jgi:hypothetical protein
MFVSTVSAQDNLTTNVKPSELEQGLIDALNSDTKNLAADYVIANYCKANEDKISTSENNNVSSKSNSRTYQLESGSNITFINHGNFLINDLKVDNNTIQPVIKKMR